MLSLTTEVSIETINRFEKIFYEWEDKVWAYLPNFVLGLVVLIIFIIFAKFLKSISSRFFGKVFKNQPDVVEILSSLVYLFFLLSGFFLALQLMQLGSVLTRLLAGAGIVGIIAGFAFKDIVSNAFSGLLIKYQHPFKIGDWVKVGDSYGTVGQIGAITTQINNIYGQLVYVPNQLIYTNVFINYTNEGKRMVVLKSGVSYGDDLEKVKTVALDEIQKFQWMLPQEPFDFYFTGIGSSTYDFEVRFWIAFENQRQYLNAKSDCIIRLKKRFEQEDISIAYNVTTLDFGVKGGVNLFDQDIRLKP